MKLLHIMMNPKLHNLNGYYGAANTLSTAVVWVLNSRVPRQAISIADEGAADAVVAGKGL